MADRVKDWSNFRHVEPARALVSNGSNGHLKTFAHVCDRQHCRSHERFLEGDAHYPHTGAWCHSLGEDPARCRKHGTLLQFYGGFEGNTPYPAPLCLDCLPPHRPHCPLLAFGNTCTCPDRLRPLGQLGRRGGGSQALAVGALRAAS